MSKELLELRKGMKKKKPNFIRQDAHKKKRVGTGWRVSRGTDSKMRLGLSGYRKSPSQGYRSPVLVRGLDRSGLIPVRVSTISELDKIKKETEGIIINNAIGTKKRMAIIEKAEASGIKILNIKNPAEYLKQKKDIMQKKKEAKDKKLAEKEKKHKEKEKKADEKKENLSEKVTEEEKKDQEKKEKDKVLTKKK